MVEKFQNNMSTIVDSGVQETMQGFLMTMENFVTSSVTTEISFSTSEMDILTHVVNESVTSNFMMETPGGSVFLSQKLFISKIVRISTVVFHDTIGECLGGYNNFEGAKVSSKVVSVSLEEQNKTLFDPMPVHEEGAIVITLPTDIVNFKREKARFCTYWNFEQKGWASDGGTILEKNDSHTTCMFNHLTNFAVLVLYYDEDAKVSISQEKILMIMTTIGCSLSISCLGITILTYAYLKLLMKETILIHGNLSIALLCAQLVLVASDDALGNKVACKVVAMILHYCFLSSFTWMMVEGIALYLSCTRGLRNNNDMRMKYLCLGWGIPLIIVTISIGAEFPNYGNGERKSCWLSTEDGLIWAFMGPMLTIIVFNILVLVVVVKVFLSLQKMSGKTEIAKARGSIRAMVFLLPLLGITWILSILVPLHPAFHYLFVVGNSIQGMMIFFLHCICNEEIRKKFMEKRKKLTLSQKTFADSEMVVMKNMRKKADFCDVQLELPSTDRKYAWVS